MQPDIENAQRKMTTHRDIMQIKIVHLEKF